MTSGVFPRLQVLVSAQGQRNHAQRHRAARFLAASSVLGRARLPVRPPWREARVALRAEGRAVRQWLLAGACLCTGSTAAVSHGSRRAGAAGMPNDTSLCKTKDRGAACLESPRSASKPHYVVWCVVCVWNIR